MSKRKNGKGPTFDESAMPTFEEMQARDKKAIADAGAATEAEMREAPAPCPKTADELAAYIAGLCDRPHDYGTCAYAMSLAAVAAFHYVAHRLGTTGFQASCADMDFLRRTRHLEHGFMLVDASRLLYPQYDLLAEVRRFLSSRLEDLKDEARKLLATNEGASAVRKRWSEIAAGLVDLDAPAARDWDRR